MQFFKLNVELLKRVVQTVFTWKLFEAPTAPWLNIPLSRIGRRFTV
jgi:hypothetical protein